MAIRFQADADLNQIIVSAVLRRVPTIDFKTATAAGLGGLADEEVLARAAREGRILVTHTRRRCLDTSGNSCRRSAARDFLSFRSILRFDRSWTT